MDVNSEGIPWRAGCGEPDGVSLACNRVVGSGGGKASECMQTPNRFETLSLQNNCCPKVALLSFALLSWTVRAGGRVRYTLGRIRLFLGSCLILGYFSLARAVMHAWRETRLHILTKM